MKRLQRIIFVSMVLDFSLFLLLYLGASLRPLGLAAPLLHLLFGLVSGICLFAAQNRSSGNEPLLLGIYWIAFLLSCIGFWPLAMLFQWGAALGAILRLQRKDNYQPDTGLPLTHAGREKSDSHTIATPCKKTADSRHFKEILLTSGGGICCLGGVFLFVLSITHKTAEFGAFSLLLMLLASTPPLLLLPALLRAGAPASMKTILQTMQYATYALLLLSWTIMAVRTGLLPV